MSIQPQWKQKYDGLKDYVAANPEIHIDSNELSIPEHLRAGFYERFDDIRNSFVDTVFTSLPFEMNSLCENYTWVEKEITDSLELKRIDLPVDLSSFLHNPKESLTRGIFNRLFEMVQGKISLEDFEQMAGYDLTVTASELFRLGYESWAALSISLLLEPDQAFSVSLDEDFDPVVSELEEIAFGRQFHHSAKRIPEFILHSKKLDSYVAVKMPLVKEIGSYYLPYELPTKKLLRDHTGDTSSVLDYRVLFLSIFQDLNKIPVFADLFKREINGPELMVEFLTEQDLSDKDEITQIQNRLNIMKPGKGSSIVLINSEPDSGINKPVEDIDIFKVGLDTPKLHQVIDKLL
ncbi:hypothetical protein ACFL1N_08165 [Thermodesulfobacteriota bacterium]